VDNAENEGICSREREREREDDGVMFLFLCPVPVQVRAYKKTYRETYRGRRAAGNHLLWSLHARTCYEVLSTVPGLLSEMKYRPRPCTCVRGARRDEKGKARFAERTSDLRQGRELGMRPGLAMKVAP
jgi:hypothetical protein